MNPRARRRRLDRPRSWPGVRPAPVGDASSRATRRRFPDAEPTAAPRAESAGGGESRPLLDAIIADFTTRWRSGEPVQAEDYFDQVPPISAAIAELIYQEYCLAEADNLDPDPSVYIARFPHHSAALSRLFSLHSAWSVTTLRELVEPGDLPDAGDEIGPYRLLRELGRGAFARVFLAEQADLGDRLVVVKVATRPSAEPTLLARARHANIVEVLRHTEANDGALHLVCLPFLGGATLGAILGARRPRGPSGRPRLPRSGRQWLDDLDRVAAPEYPATGLPRPAREVVARLSYPQALAWMIARLAEALDHAERRGVTHGDIKPSNILMTADGMPMLFDFNLAVDWHATDSWNAGADLGGTLAYMAPERLRVLGEPTDPTANLARRQPDRHRADLYALGLVLVEALTGEPPTVPDRHADDPRQFASGLARLRADSLAEPSRRSWSIPPALRVILARCLAPDPSDRYARGAELADDLDRWRSDRPLIHAPEPARSSWGRRFRSFRFSIIATALTLAAALVVGLLAWSVLQGTQRDQALAKWSSLLDRTDGLFRFRTFGNWRPDSPEDPVDLATRLLSHYEVMDNPSWRNRADVRTLPERERGELELWIAEQVLRRTVALRDRPESPADWRRALALLNREIAVTPYTAFLRERDRLREQLGLEQSGNAITPVRRVPAPWAEAYLLGVAVEPLHAREALGHYLDALTARPGLFWAEYRAAVVACRIDELPTAIRYLRACVARQPASPALHTLLASTMYALARHAVPGSSLVNLGEAQAECDRALALNPDFTEANRARTLINRMLGQTDSVRADLERFSLLNRPRQAALSVLLQINSRLLPEEQAQPYTEAEEARLRQAIAQGSSNENNKATLADHLVIADRTDEAAELYRQVIDVNPSHLRARFQNAIEKAKTGCPEAYDEFAELIEHPRFEEIYVERPDGFRAFHYLARHLLEEGRYQEAEVLVRRSLAAINKSSALRDESVQAWYRGKHAINPRAETSYNFARVNAVAARTDPSRLATAIAYLEEAFAASPVFREERFANDRLFNPFRRQILEQIDGEQQVKE